MTAIPRSAVFVNAAEVAVCTGPPRGGVPSLLRLACPHLPAVTLEDITAAATDMAAKRAVIKAVDEAKKAGMNGAPFMLLDDEPFWGADRLDQLELRLKEKQR